MSVFKEVSKCRVCGSHNLTEVINLKSQHLSATFVKDNIGLDIAKIKVPLTLVLCDKRKNNSGCGMLQLKEEVQPDLMYRQYFYRSSTSDMMRKDLENVIEDIRSRVDLQSGDIVVDIGANDCTTINFYPPNLRRIGIEPAKNISWDHVDKSITILNDYFSELVFRQAFPTEMAKAVGCNAMFYDLDDPNTFVSDVRKILHPEGVWCIQLSYLPLMLENMNFYDICHEHLAYYSLDVLKTLMDRNGLAVFDASINHVNGGSLRVFISHKNNTKAQTKEGRHRLKVLEDKEKTMSLDLVETYKAFYKKMESLSSKVVDYMNKEIGKGHKIVGLGASTKGNVLLQFFGITKEMMPYISERNIDKVGLRTMGTDFELISEERAREMKPSAMLVLPWYFKDEIVKREAQFLNDGGALLIPMPYAHLVTRNGEIKL